MYRDEKHEHRIIQTDYECQNEELDNLTDAVMLRDYAKRLANDLRCTRENLADWRWGHLTKVTGADKEDSVR